MKNTSFLKVGAGVVLAAALLSSNAMAQDASVDNLQSQPVASQAVDGSNPVKELGSVFGSFLKKVGAGIEKMSDQAQQNMEKPAPSATEDGKVIEKASVDAPKAKEIVSNDGVLKPIGGVTINTGQIKNDFKSAIGGLRDFFNKNTSTNENSGPSGP